ncbi:Hypothetical predicted protein [Octopus vulgaris]|uniref:Uncharacterized protein n=1 Tax=Octopus vulgaris TaxID=6645 RepID=A0AA36EXR0_OCTVU|nr:Hypothetical predicted protein [Octopus vulgaris]
MQHNEERINSENEAIAGHSEGFTPDTLPASRYSKERFFFSTNRERDSRNNIIMCQKWTPYIYSKNKQKRKSGANIEVFNLPCFKHDNKNQYPKIQSYIRHKILSSFSAESGTLEDLRIDIEINILYLFLLRRHLIDMFPVYKIEEYHDSRSTTLCLNIKSHASVE